MHRKTVRGTRDLAPGFDLPLHLDMNGVSPFGPGLWQGRGIAFRWDDGTRMRN